VKILNLATKKLHISVRNNSTSRPATVLNKNKGWSALEFFSNELLWCAGACICSSLPFPQPLFPSCGSRKRIPGTLPGDFLLLIVNHARMSPWWFFSYKHHKWIKFTHAQKRLPTNSRGGLLLTSRRQELKCSRDAPTHLLHVPIENIPNGSREQSLNLFDEAWKNEISFNCNRCLTLAQLEWTWL